MGLISGMQCMVLTQTRILDTKQSEYNRLADQRQLLSTKSSSLSEEKSYAMSSEDDSSYEQLQCQQEQLDALEEALDVKMKQAESEIKIAQQRVEAAEKMRDKSIEKDFKAMA